VVWVPPGRRAHAEVDFDELTPEQQEEIFDDTTPDYEGTDSQTYGTLSDTSVETDEDGVAETTYTLGTAEGYAEFILADENASMPEQGIEEASLGAGVLQPENVVWDWITRLFRGSSGSPATYSGNYKIGTGPPPGLAWTEEPYGVETPTSGDWTITYEGLQNLADYWADGYPNARGCLQHFLDNAGTSRTVDLAAMIAASGSVSSLRNRELADALKFAKYLGQTRGAGTYGIVRRKAVSASCHDSEDWFLAINNFQAYGEGQVVVQPGGLHGSLYFTFYLFDPYNWDADRSMDRAIHRLHRVGYAREYLNTGAAASPAQTW